MAEPVTPQLRKLGIVPGARWSVVGADPGWAFELAPDAADEVAASAPADVVVAFARTTAELVAQLDAAQNRIFPAGALWIAWPRKAAGHVSELGDTVVRQTTLARGHLVDTKVAALDHDWSALRFVWRRERRVLDAARDYCGISRVRLRCHARPKSTSKTAPMARPATIASGAPNDMVWAAQNSTSLRVPPFLTIVAKPS